jgi:toxin YoeB
MRVIFASAAWEDCLYWQAHDARVLKRIHALIKEAGRNPRSGIGKPEPLRYNLSGYSSRRITEEHRMVHTMEGGNLVIAQLRYQYELERDRPPHFPTTSRGGAADF